MTWQALIGAGLTSAPDIIGGIKGKGSGQKRMLVAIGVRFMRLADEIEKTEPTGASVAQRIRAMVGEFAPKGSEERQGIALVVRAARTNTGTDDWPELSEPTNAQTTTSR